MRIGEDRTKQNRCFDFDLRNLDFNAGFPPRQPLFKYNDNHILVGYSRSFWLRFMSTRYPFTCKILWGHMSHNLLVLPSIFFFITMSLFLVGIRIISFGSFKLKLRHFNAKLVSMPSSLGYLLLFPISGVLTP